MHDDEYEYYDEHSGEEEEADRSTAANESYP
jgi:hypothetical protein